MPPRRWVAPLVPERRSPSTSFICKRLINVAQGDHRMGIVNTTMLYDGNFDFKKVTADDVVFAFVVRMPFRFRVSSPYHCHFENRGARYDIWIKNKPIPPAESGIPLHGLIQAGGSVEDLWSRVVIIPNKCGVTDAEIDALRQDGGSLDSASFESRNKQLFPAMQALNAFIIGYHTATGELFGGQALQLMTQHEYMNNVTWEVALVGIPPAHWTKDNISELFDLKAERAFRAGLSLTGELVDLPSDKLNGIRDAINRINDFYFYELAFEAKAKMVSGDYIGALLLAVAALEGAHGAFVASALEAKLPSGRTGDDKNLEDSFIKELGFSLCNKVTPYLFMDPPERPADEVIQNVATAVKYRNEIMHALRNSAGQYRIRKRTNAELTDAYSAALQLYDLYRKAVEKALSQSAGGQC